MDHNTHLLNHIYQGAEMGVHTIHQLMDKSRDPAFQDHLRTQLAEYEAIHEQAHQKLQATGYPVKDLGIGAKMGSTLSLQMQTLVDNSVSHMAEMMVQGSTMGIIETTKKLKQCDGADQEVVALGEKLLRTEQSNLEHLKGFLQ